MASTFDIELRMAALLAQMSGTALYGGLAPNIPAHTARVHGTVTGRVSSSAPNLQNLPRPKRQEGESMSKAWAMTGWGQLIVGIADDGGDLSTDVYLTMREYDALVRDGGVVWSGSGLDENGGLGPGGMCSIKAPLWKKAVAMMEADEQATAANEGRAPLWIIQAASYDDEVGHAFVAVAQMTSVREAIAWLATTRLTTIVP